MRFLRYLLIILLAAALIWLVPSEKALAEESTEPEGEIVSIPLDQTSMPKVNARYYRSTTLYEDPSLRVELSTGRAAETDYITVRIRIADPSQLRSHVEKSSDGNYGDRIAGRLNAVLLFTGDSFRTNKPSSKGKYVIRQGKKVSLQKWKDEGQFDILMIDADGNLHVLKTPTREACDAFVAEHNVVNSFAFGPGLVIDGQVQEKPEKSRADFIGWDKPAQRICLCQTGPLEYMVIVTGGPENPHCKGMTADEFIAVIQAEGSCSVAYNLDGGNSAWLVFNNEKINLFGRALTVQKRRIEDAIYFVSAWREIGGGEEP